MGKKYRCFICNTARRTMLYPIVEQIDPLIVIVVQLCRPCYLAGTLYLETRKMGEEKKES
jgi:hypothetical protein